ncbi:MAG TPA: trypsin-like peptidase domain-containing protein [Candidatus Babeliales bacterium]|nr:trypsin-like peptidase domain-containing protein [Candidatus Babeliales bacterium]
MKQVQLLFEGQRTWLGVQEAVQHSVVQVVAQVATFDWIEPYRVDEQQEARGTGFIIDVEGHVITNAHVVDQAKTVWIHVPAFGKKVIAVDVVSFCPDRDLALLRIKPEGREFFKKQLGSIIPLTLGDSDSVQRTDNVLLVGYPLGQYGVKTVTGIISGRESGDGRTLLQITAPVNLGNSGGPLINEYGEVVGIAIAMVFLAQNIGYAIPVNELKAVLEDLYKNKFVRRPTLGVRFNYATDECARYFGNPVPSGFYINTVFPGTLLEKAGVLAGDMLYEFNAYALDSFGEVIVPWCSDKLTIHDLVARVKIGDQIGIILYRAGKRIELSFTFDLVPSYAIRMMYPLYEPVDYEIFGGMVVMQLVDNHIPLLAENAPSLIDYSKMEHKVGPRLVITHIFPGSVIQQGRCFTSGFIITQVNGMAVATLSELSHAIVQNRDKEFVTIKTEDGILGVFLLRAIVEDEVRLSSDFSYPISPVMEELLKDK